MLDPQAALDYVRPRPPAALIPPFHEHASSHGKDPGPYIDAVYDTDAAYAAVLPRLVGHPAFATMAGRDPALPPGIDGISPRESPYRGGGVYDYRPEDVPLSALAGFRRAPGAPDFDRMRPRTPRPTRGSLEGDRLVLEPEAARDRLRHQPPRAPAMEHGEGHVDPTRMGGGDPHLTAWLSYRPRCVRSTPGGIWKLETRGCMHHQ